MCCPYCEGGKRMQKEVRTPPVCFMKCLKVLLDADWSLSNRSWKTVSIITSIWCSLSGLCVWVSCALISLREIRDALCSWNVTVILPIVDQAQQAYRYVSCVQLKMCLCSSLFINMAYHYSKKEKLWDKVAHQDFLLLSTSSSHIAKGIPSPGH